MKRTVQLLLLLLLWLASCKPVELRYMHNLGTHVVIQADTVTIQMEVQRKGLLIPPKTGNTYYWFENGRINSSQGAHSGKVLHGQFRSYSVGTKRLLLSGRFKRGLKSGRWLLWNTWGQLKQSETYKDGHLNGFVIKYDSLGRPIDTLKYRKGLLVMKKTSLDTTGLFSRVKKFLKFGK